VVPGLAQAPLWRASGEKGRAATWLLPRAHAGSGKQERPNWGLQGWLASEGAGAA